MKLQRQIDKLLAQRASEWHQILETGADADRAQFVQWLKASPVHVEEYLETVYTDRALEHLDAERREDVDALLAQIAPAAIEIGQPPVGTQPLETYRRPFNRWLAGLAIGAMMILCAVIAPRVFERFSPPVNYATKIGEQRTIRLADTSVVTLNADSQIEIAMTKTERKIQLLRGEALFTVAKDVARPFTVQTKVASVQAVGTQFNVYDRPAGTKVSVLEGRVLVAARHNSASLGVGEEVQVRADGTIERRSKPDVLNSVAWHERRLIFNNAPLEEMIYEFNRYSSTTRLRIEGVPAGSHHYNGIFDVADPDSLADLLSSEPDLAIERKDGEIVIRPKRSAGPRAP